MYRQSIKQNGFSLIELLVVVAIFLGLTGLAISNYSRFTQVERLRQAAKTFKTSLRLVQTKAASGAKPPSGCTTLLGYQVAFTSTSYGAQAFCREGLIGPIITTALPADVLFSPIPSPFMFEVLTGTVSNTVSVTLVSVSRTYGVQVDRSGDVNDLGGVTPTPTYPTQGTPTPIRTPTPKPTP